MLTESRLLFVFLLSTACRVDAQSGGEYGLEITDPVLQVTPTALDAGVICAGAPHVETVYLANTGTDLLEIHDLNATGGWKVLSTSTPIYIPVGEQVPISVQTATETGMLAITSSDPENPIQQVLLYGEADMSPSIEMSTQLQGDILHETVGLTALVSDDHDKPTDLVVEWSTSTDGVFATSVPDENGLVSAVWDGSYSMGEQTIRGTVKDSCDNRSEKDVSLCRQLHYVSQTLDFSTWHYEGSANWSSEDGWLELTPAEQGQVGTAFSTDQQVPAGQVEIEFQFYIGDGTGADGLSLTAMDVDRMTSFMGGEGCGLGYGAGSDCTVGPALPGWSIEVDTYFNLEQDPTPADHVMFTFDGDVGKPAVWAELPEMEDTGWHTMRVLVDQPHVLVEIDGVPYIDQDISGFYDFDAYVGFTAATGGDTNRQLIDSLVITEKLCGDE